MKNINSKYKYKVNEKINLYKENLIKFINTQKDIIIPICSLDDIDFLIGILFLTETNRYFKQNKIIIHAYYLAYTFINLFNKIRKKMLIGYIFELSDINHFILSLSNNINYLNSRIDSSNNLKNKINNNISNFILEILPILNKLIEYNKHHDNDINNLEIIDTKYIDSKKYNKNKCCDIECYFCWISHILTKFFYILLQTAKFLGSGSYNDPNLLRLSEYYANLFYTLFKSRDKIFMHNNVDTLYTELYENYLNYKNKLNYSLIELDLNSETLDEIIKYLDNLIIENLIIKIN